MISIKPLSPADHDHWLALWLGYQTFYKVQLPAQVNQSTWERIHTGRIQAVGAYNQASRLVGFAHFLYHEDTWSLSPACYLEDLFVEPGLRGSGCGRLLVEAVASAAVKAGAHKTYWLTHETNTVARQLYDRLGKHPGFVYYSFGPSGD